MADFLNQQVNPPENWQEFEKISADLWAKIWNDPNTQQNGRGGQAQHGVDVFGQKGGDGDWLGVQCKGKDGRYGHAVTKTELINEVKKALKFTPKIKEFILATTAENDANIQQVAREITEAHKKKGLFSVTVLGWSEIHRRLADYPDLICKYYPDQGPVSHRILKELESISDAQLRTEASAPNLVQELQGQMQAFRKEMTVILSQVSSDTSNKEVSDAEKAVNAEIDRYRELLNSHRPKTAKDLLEGLKGNAWDTSSNWIKFRIATNIAAANLALGAHEVAAEQFIEARQYAPEDEKARTNEVLAHILVNDYEVAVELANNVIADFPNNPTGYSLRISALSKIEGSNIDLSDVPEIVHDSKEVLYSAANYYMAKGEFESHRKWVSQAYIKYPDDLDVKGMYGTSLLQEIADDKAYIFGWQRTDEKNKQLESAINLLQDVWGEYAKTEIPHEHLYIAENLVTAERMASNYAAATKLIDEVLKIAPDAKGVKFKKALLLVEAGDTDGALVLLNELYGVGYEGGGVLYADILLRSGKVDDACAVIDDILSKDIGGKDIEVANCLMLECAAKAKGWDAFNQVAEIVHDKFPDSIQVNVTLARIYGDFGKDEIEDKYLEMAAKTGVDKMSVIDVLLIADALFNKELYHRAANFYSHIIKSYADSEPLRRYVLSLYEADRRKDLIGVLDKLPAETRSISYYKRLASAVFVRTGDFVSAEKEAHDYLQVHHGDLHVAIHWLNTLYRLGRVDDIRKYLDEVDVSIFVDTVPADKMTLAKLYDRFGFYDKSLELAYNLLLENQNVASMNAAYIGLIMVGQAARNLSQENVVKQNVAFTIESDIGEGATYLIDDVLSESGKCDYAISSEHPIAVAAMGRCVGDKIEYGINPYQSAEGVIQKIQSKYTYQANVTAKQFSARFPTDTSFFMLNLARKRDDDELDVEPVLKSVSDRQERINEILEMYRVNPYSVGMIAQMVGRNPVEVWQGFKSDKDVEIYCCGGTASERDYALNIVRQNRSGYVVDPLTLYDLYHSEQRDMYIAITGRLTVTVSCLELFKCLVEDYEYSIAEGGEKQITKSGDGYVLYNIEPESFSVAKEQVEQFIRWVEDSCDVVPAVGNAKEPELTTSIASLMDHAFTDCMYVAADTGKALISNDVRLRSFAKELFVVDGVWQQVLLIVALENGIIDLDAYTDDVVKLIEFGYNFTTVNHFALKSAADRSEWGISDKFSAIASAIGTEQIDIASSVKVARNFLKQVWGGYYNDVKARNLTFALLNGATNHYTHSLSGPILAGFIYIGRAFEEPLRSAYYNCINEWGVGHFVRFEDIIGDGLEGLKSDQR